MSKPTTYQAGELPTVSEMEDFAKRFKPEDWEKLIQNTVFVKTYDKDLNAMAIASEMILADRYVGSLSDLKYK